MRSPGPYAGREKNQQNGGQCSSDSNVLHRSLPFNDSDHLNPQLNSYLAHGVLTPLIATMVHITLTCSRNPGPHASITNLGQCGFDASMNFCLSSGNNLWLDPVGRLLWPYYRRPFV